jgi:hypothetical protein
METLAHVQSATMILVPVFVWLAIILAKLQHALELQASNAPLAILPNSDKL